MKKKQFAKDASLYVKTWLNEDKKIESFEEEIEFFE